MRKAESNFIVFSVMLCWASAYIFIKSLPEELSSFGYLTLINGIAAILLLLCFGSRLKKLDRSTALHGVGLAVIMMLVLIFEKEGVERLPSSSASILTSLDIIFLPLLMLIFYKRIPSKQKIVGIVFILAGVLITNGLSLSDFPVAGTLFMLGDCICMSVYTVVSSRFCQKDDAITLAVVQMVVMGAVSAILWTIESPGMIFRLHYTKSFLASIFVLAFFSKAYAFIMLMFGEKYSDPVDIVIIFALEPIVTLALAVLIPQEFGGVEEIFSTSTLVGAVCIAIGATVAEVDLDVIRKRRRRKA